MFPIELLGVKTKPAKSAHNLGVIYDKISPSAHLFLQSAAHAFTICGICGVFVITLIWIVLNCLLQLSCPVVLIIVIHFCIVLLTLTSQGFMRVQNQMTRLVTKSTPITLSIPLLRSLHWLPVRFKIDFKINLLTYKALREIRPVYLHSMLAASIPSRSLRSNNDNSLSVPRIKTNTGARTFHSCTPSLWNNLPLSVRSAISVVTFKKYLKTHLFDLASPPHRYLNSPWPVDVTEPFSRFCC